MKLSNHKHANIHQRERSNRQEAGPSTFIFNALVWGVWKPYKVISLTSTFRRKQKHASFLSSSLLYGRRPNPDPHRRTAITAVKIKSVLFLVNHNTGWRSRPPRARPRAGHTLLLKLETTRASQATEPAIAAASLQAAAHAQPPT